MNEIDMIEIKALLVTLIITVGKIGRIPVWEPAIGFALVMILLMIARTVTHNFL